MDKKGQVNSGTVTAIVIGVAGILIAFFIAFTIADSLIDSEPLLDSDTNTITNETGAYANGTSYTLANAGANNVLNSRSFTLTDVWSTNTTDTSGGYILQWANYSTYFSLDATTGILTNISGFNHTLQGNLSVSYTYTSDGDQEESARAMSANFSEGADNVSEQVPTILLIAAIVLVLAVIAILFMVWRRFSFGSSTL